MTQNEPWWRLQCGQCPAFGGHVVQQVKHIELARLEGHDAHLGLAHQPQLRNLLYSVVNENLLIQL